MGGAKLARTANGINCYKGRWTRAYSTALYIDFLGSGWAEATLTTHQPILHSLALSSQHVCGGKVVPEGPTSLLFGLFPQQLFTVNIKAPAAS